MAGDLKREEFEGEIRGMRQGKRVSGCWIFGVEGNKGVGWVEARGRVRERGRGVQSKDCRKSKEVGESREETEEREEFKE